MTLKYRIIIAVSLLTLVGTGCQQENSRPMVREEPTLQNSTAIINYLERLPAVKSVTPWHSAYGPGIVIKTAHYEIYTTLNEPLMLRQVPGFLESAYRGYQKQLPRPIETHTPFKTYIFGTRKQWEEFTRHFTGPDAEVYLKINRGAYYLKGATVSYNIGRSRTFGVLAHEGWHQFNSKHFKYRLPSWIDEGIAMHFEAFEYNNGWFTFEPSENYQRLGSLKLMLQKGKMMPLSKLITLNPGQVLIHSDSEAAVAFYSQAYALVRFLREAHYGKRLVKYNNMLNGGLEGTWPMSKISARIAADRNIPMTAGYNSIAARRLFEIYINENLDKLNAEYLRFCYKITSRLIVTEPNKSQG